MPVLEPSQNHRLQAHVLSLLAAWEKKHGTRRGFQADLVRRLADVGYVVSQPSINGWLSRGKFAHDSARALARLAGYTRAESLMGEFSDMSSASGSDPRVASSSRPVSRRRK